MMNGLHENQRVPVSALLLVGLCPALAACTTFWNGLLTGLVTVILFALVRGILYLLRGVLHGGTRTAVLLITAAALAGIAALLVEAYFPTQYAVIGLYLPLTALSCVILDLISPQSVTADALPVLARSAVWFVLTLSALGLLREFLGAGTLFGTQILPSDMASMALFSGVPGAFLTLAFLLMAARAAGQSLEIPGEEERT